MSDTPGEPAISFEVALAIADSAVFDMTSRHLKNIEVAVLKGVWLGKKYDQIAEESGYAPEYIKHDVGPKLWQLLSSGFGEKVSKTNLIAILVQRTQQNRRANELPEEELLSNIPQSSRAVDLESPAGLVPLGSLFYIERPPIESRCYEEIMKPGALVRIKAPSQMGKTSLMVRILAHARQQLRHSTSAQEARIVPLSLQRADRTIFSDLDQFLQWFCASITRKLELPHRVEDYWSETFGSKGNCTAYFEDYLLLEDQGALVLAIDQVDEVFAHPAIADDFFALLRSWYEEAAYGDTGNTVWQNLRLIIVHSTEVYIPLDINQSPFNVGLAIELREFSPNQALDLAERHGLKLSEQDLSTLMKLVSGHPYLLRQAFYCLAQQDMTLHQLIETAATDAGIYHNHLHRHLQNLQQHPQLASAFDQVVKSTSAVELEQKLAFKLHSMGLIKLRGNQVMPSCELYQRYFAHRAISL
jgi:hypothetical protein